MAYSNWGAFVYRNGERMKGNEDAAPFATGADSLEAEGIPSGAKIWVHLMREKAEGATERKPWDGLHHAVLGSGPVRLCGYKAYPIIFVAEEVGIRKIDAYNDPAFDKGEEIGGEILGHQWTAELGGDSDNQVSLTLVEPDGTSWTSTCGYGIGAGYEEDDMPETADTTPETPPTESAEAIAPVVVIAAEPPTEPVIADAATEPAPDLPKWRVLSKPRVKLDVDLTTEERLAASDRACELGEKADIIEREIDYAKEAWRDKLKTLQAKLDTAKDEHREALRARHTGKEARRFDAEERAVIATCTIDVVLVESGIVHTSRPMTEAEQARYCRQGDITDATEGATITPAPTGEGGPSAPAEPDTSERWADGGPNALYPAGWPVAWKGREWLVQIGDDPKALREGDVLEVYYRCPAEGDGLTVKDLSAVVGWVPRQGITHALRLLKDAGLARSSARKWWGIVPAAPAVVEVAEPGRADPLPEAGDITRPRLAEPETVADAMLADAGEVAAGYGIPS